MLGLKVTNIGSKPNKIEVRLHLFIKKKKKEKKRDSRGGKGRIIEKKKSKNKKHIDRCQCHKRRKLSKSQSFNQPKWLSASLFLLVNP